jgi:hypothetical protein
MMKRRIRSVKEEGNYNKINRDFIEVVSNYKRYTTKKEWRYYLLLPFVISTLIFISIGLLEDSNINLMKSILDINQLSLTVMAILAGFNTTSLSIIAASNIKILRYLKNVKLENEEQGNESALKQIVSFFSFAIIYQLIVLVIGIVLEMSSKNLKDFAELVPFMSGLVVRIPLTVLGAFWLASILFALIISLRNATLLYRYVLFIADYSDEE